MSSVSAATNWRRFCLRAGVSVAVLAVLLWWLPTESLFTAIKRISPGVWLFVLAGFLAGHALSALKWRLLLQVVQVPISTGAALKAHAAGLFANLCLPSIIGGDVVRAAYVVRDKGSMAPVAVASLADRLNDTLALLLLAMGAALAMTFVPADSLVTLVSGSVSASGAAATVAAVATPSTVSETVRTVLIVIPVLFVALIALGLALVFWLPASRLPARAERAFDKVREAVHLLMASPLPALLALVLSLLIQSFFIALNIVLAGALGLSLAAAVWFLAWPLAKLVALLPVSLGGIGVRDAALMAFLVPYGAEASLAVAQSLSWQAVLIAAGLLCGLLVTMLPGSRSAWKWGESQA